MKKLCKTLVAVILCMSMILGGLPVKLIGEDIAKAADILAAAAPVEVSGFQDLLEQLDQGISKTSGVWQYVLFSGQQYAVITGHMDYSVTSANVPDQLGGADVVAIADGSFASHNALISVTIPGNVFAMGKNAIPAGVAVCAVNASYAQTWARKNGHGFNNTSELKLRSGVVDLAGTRTENFLRVNEKEVHLRELEAKRLKVGNIFFLPDSANIYQISYYRVESISKPVGGFVTITCSTPLAEDVVTHITAENEMMMPDYSTLHLEDGVKMADQSRWNGKDINLGLGVSLAIPKKELAGLKLSLEGGLDINWKASYDIGLFSDKWVKLVETKTISVTAGVEAKQEKIQSKERMDTLDEMEDWITKTKWRNDEKPPEPIRQKLMSAAIFSAFGIVYGVADVYLTLELSGEIEVSFSNTYTTTTYYHNGRIERTADCTDREAYIKGEASVKIGITGALDFYIFALKVASVSMFVGIKATASLKIGIHQLGETDVAHVNPNMFDCVEIEADAVVEVGGSIGIGDFAQISGSTTLCTKSILPDTGHWHLCPFEYDFEEDHWKAIGNKNQFHWAEECPYDWKTVSFVSQDRNGKYQTIQQYFDVIRGTAFSNSVRDELKELIRGNYNRKVLGWFTDKSYSDDAEVTFPLLVSRQDDHQLPTQTIYEKTTLYAKTAYYRDTYLIDSSGAKLKNFTASIVRDGNSENWTEGKAIIAGEEQIVLPAFFTKDGKEYAVKKWMEVVSDKQRTVISEPINPRESYTVNGLSDAPIYIMAMTDEDIIGRFVSNCANPGETIDAYCEVGGSLTAPIITDTTTSELKGWEVYGETANSSVRLGYISPDASFSTEGLPYMEYMFYADWQRKANLTYDPVTSPGFGPIQAGEYSGNTTPTNEGYLTFSSDGRTVTGIKPEYVNIITELVIPEKHESSNTPITAITSNAFQGNSHLISVFIPASITSIGSSAFQNCENLKRIVIAASTNTFSSSSYLTSIPAAFAKNCGKLELVILTDRISGIGSNAFEGCTSLESARLNCLIFQSALKGCTCCSSNSVRIRSSQ